MIDYNLNLITGPASEPVELEDCKNWIKVENDETYDDDLINSLIVMARDYCERYTKRALFTQTWEIVSSYDLNPVNFPLGQLQSITSVKVVNEDGTESTQSTDLYHTTLDNDNGRLWLKNGSIWSTTTRDYDNFIVRFICGWDDVDNIPEIYKTGIKKLVAYMYENRNYSDSDVYLLLQQTGVGKLYT